MSLPVSASAATLTWPLIKSGSTGANAYAAQYLLNYWGYGPTLVVDGIFGANSVSATKNFQTKKKLASDGIIGANTWTALTAVTQSTSGYSTNATKAIQYLLRNKYKLSSVSVNGVFDTNTKNAVMAVTLSGNTAFIFG